MPSILERIVAAKRGEVEAARERVSEESLKASIAAAPPVRDFLAALQTPPGMQVIAEFKRASPSAGTIRDDLSSVELARIYEAHGAACISVLTDGPFFKGSLADLTAVRNAVSLPVLRKDFIIDRYQVLEARRAGADAVLLIAEILTDEQLSELHQEIHRLEMTALVELYEPANLERVVAAGARLIGVNNRNLHTFETTLEHTIALAGKVPKDRCLVSESGIRTRADVERLERAGAKAILVGETLMKAPDPGTKLRELIGENEE